MCTKKKCSDCFSESSRDSCLICAVCHLAEILCCLTLSHIRRSHSSQVSRSDILVCLSLLWRTLIRRHCLWLSLLVKRLNSLQVVFIPQETSERFGLRTTKEDAIERAHYFHQWHSQHVDDSHEEIPKKGFIIATIRLSAAGYLSKMEGGILVKTKETEYRWFGEIKMEERLPDRRPLYEILDMEEII